MKFLLSSPCLECFIIGVDQSKDNPTCRDCPLRSEYVKLIDNHLPGEGSREEQVYHIYVDEDSLKDTELIETDTWPWKWKRPGRSKRK